nr:IS3 family transposase [Burkholderia anthina]
MVKYDEKFKREVVRRYASGRYGYKSVAREFGLHPGTVQRWVSSHEQHGEAGLRKKYSRYSATFKLKVLRRMWRDQLSYRQAAALFNLRGNDAVSRWERQYHEGGLGALAPKPKGRLRKMPTPTPPAKPIDTETEDTLTREALLAELKYLRAEVAYLKKWNALVQAKEAAGAEKARLVLELRQDHDLSDLLRAAGLARSTFYYQAKVQMAGDKYASLKVRIRQIYEHHKGRYGYRRVTAELRRAGQAINHKTVQRLMQVLGLKSLVRPKKYRSYRGELAQVPNRLERQFRAERPNQKWVTDVTEFNVQGDKLYLSPVMDLYNGEIVAYETQKRPHFRLVGNMLKKALVKLTPLDAPLLHSDQGWQYQMPAYRRQLAARGLTQSMSRKGNCLDNAAMESFFGTLKAEFFYLNKFASVEQLRDGLRRYIHYYNHQRIKTKLKGLSPVQYRTQPSSA